MGEGKQVLIRTAGFMKHFQEPFPFFSRLKMTFRWMARADATPPTQELLVQEVEFRTSGAPTQLPRYHELSRATVCMEEKAAIAICTVGLLDNK